MSKILLVGATGYVGRYLSIYLKEQGYDVLALGRNKEILGFLEENGVKTMQFNILDKNDYNKLLSEDILAIVNLAVALPEHEVPLESFYNINVLGNLNLLEFAKTKGIKKFVMASTHKVYYDIYDSIITENMLPNFKGPHSPYIISKITAENWMQYYSKDYNMDCIVLRLTGVHGYGSLMGFLQKDGTYTRGGCEWIMEHAIKGEDVEVWGDISIKRDHVYVKDVITAFEAAINSPIGTKGIFNVSSGKAYSLYDEACVIVEVFNKSSKKSTIKLCPEKQGVQRGYLYSIEKIKNEIGWTPKYVELRDMYEDYKKEWESGKFHNWHYIKPDCKPITF